MAEFLIIKSNQASPTPFQLISKRFAFVFLSLTLFSLQSNADSHVRLRLLAPAVVLLLRSAPASVSSSPLALSALKLVVLHAYLLPLLPLRARAQALTPATHAALQPTLGALLPDLWRCYARTVDQLEQSGLARHSFNLSNILPFMFFISSCID